MIQILLAATAAFVPPLGDVPMPQPDARPAIWVINDTDTTIYLFGTFHALDGKSRWFNDEVLTAFTASDELVLETLVPRPAAMRSPAAAIAPVPTIAGSASFMSTTRMVMSAGRASGLSTAHGADTVLRDAAEGEGKAVHGLERFEEQLGMFSRLPPTPRPANAQAAQATMTAMGQVLAYLQAAWNRGDIDSFAPMLDEMAAKSPETYRMIFADRNVLWADWIARRLDQPGTVFVAVGAGHLAGRDSVQAKLAAAGVRSARIN